MRKKKKTNKQKPCRAVVKVEWVNALRRNFTVPGSW